MRNLKKVENIIKDLKKERHLARKKRKQTTWEQIKTFLTIPEIFKMRELQILVEDDIRGKNPSISQKKVKEEVLGLSKGIVTQIKKEIKAKYQIHDDVELERKVHQMKIKERIDEHLRLCCNLKSFSAIEIKIN